MANVVGRARRLAKERLGIKKGYIISGRKGKRWGEGKWGGRLIRRGSKEEENVRIGCDRAEEWEGKGCEWDERDRERWGREEVEKRWGWRYGEGEWGRGRLGVTWVGSRLGVTWVGSVILSSNCLSVFTCWHYFSYIINLFTCLHLFTLFFIHHQLIYLSSLVHIIFHTSSTYLPVFTCSHYFSYIINLFTCLHLLTLFSNIKLFSCIHLLTLFSRIFIWQRLR